MKEKVMIIVIAIILGLILATAAFYLFQTTKKSSQNNSEKNHQNINASEKNSVNNKNENILSINFPMDESIVNKRTIEVKGKTNPSNTIIASSNLDDAVATPDTNGDFSVDLDIDTGANIITIRSIAPDGTQTETQRIVTYSTEDF